MLFRTRPAFVTAARLLVAIVAGVPLSCSPSQPGPADGRDEPAVAAEALSAAKEEDAGRANGPEPPASAFTIPEDMLGVPGGAFVMGENDRGEGDERPAHRVTVTPFLLDRTEVTNEAYGRCVAAGACRPHLAASAEKNHLGDDRRFRSPAQPITAVSQADAAAFCAWLGRRLPTEAEFERACRGRGDRRYPWGDEPPTPELAVFSGDVSAPVGSRPAGAGPYGHLDLAGNVWEWSADRYDPFAYTREGASRGVPGPCREILEAQDELRRRGRQGFTGTNPIPTECEFSLRGGAFNYPAPGLRCSNRVHHPGRFRMVMSGLRCAADWPGGPSDQ